MSRSSWKLPYIDLNLLFNLGKYKKKSHKISSLSRKSTILPIFFHKNFSIYNGKKFIDLNIQPSMLGHKLGEFAPTRVKYQFKKGKKKKK
jgi:small subunit ribosomal protein S19